MRFGIYDIEREQRAPVWTGPEDCIHRHYSSLSYSSEAKPRTGRRKAKNGPSRKQSRGDDVLSRRIPRSIDSIALMIFRLVVCLAGNRRLPMASFVAQQLTDRAEENDK